MDHQGVVFRFPEDAKEYFFLTYLKFALFQAAAVV